MIDLPRITDSRGNLTVVENGSDLPFRIERVFWTYDVPGGQVRGGHAYHRQHELIIALSGAFDVVVRGGHQERRYTLNRSYFGLYLPPLTWRHMENFSTNSFSLHLSSTPYDREDYIRDFDEFVRIRSGARQ